ncbi:MAG: hypothetical protein QNJ27_00440 [Simkaniaceae bacterium]|nr:hypothetical protein [Simkaniaceae bacterium]
MKKNEKLSQIRRTAAEVLAAAISVHDCKTFVIKGGEMPWGFYFDFIFVNPFSKQMLPHIEEKMRKIVADNVEIKMHEMLPSNAAAFMRHNKRPYPAHFVQSCHDPLVQVIQIGAFVDHVQGSFLRKTRDLKAFKLLKIEQRPDLYFKGNKKGVYRIVGVADESKDALKAFMKKYKSWIGIDHLTIGEKLNLFEIDLSRGEDYFEAARIYWKKEGEALLYRIYSFWRQAHLKEGFEIVRTGSAQLTQAHKRLYQLSKTDYQSGPICFAEFCFPTSNEGFSPIHGLVGSNICHKDCSHIFCVKKDLLAALHSSLLFFNKISKLLPFTYSIEASCPDELAKLFKQLPIKTKIYPAKEARIEWKLCDAFGRSWKGPFLTLRKKDEIFTIKRSLFSSVERLIGLILEAPEKDLSQKKELLDKMASCDQQDE